MLPARLSPWMADAVLTCNSFAKGILYPFYLLRILPSQQHGIEPTGRVKVQSSQVMSGSANEFALFGCGDTGCCTAIPVAGAHSDFNKNQRGTIPHDQINFTETATVVLCHELQALPLQKEGCQMFCFTSLHDGLPKILPGGLC